MTINIIFVDIKNVIYNKKNIDNNLIIKFKIWKLANVKSLFLSKLVQKNYYNLKKKKIKVNLYK